MRNERSEHELRELAEHHGQEHVFRFWKELRKEERARLLFQLDSIDFELISELVRRHADDIPTEAPALPGDLRVAPVIALSGDGADSVESAEAREAGEELLAAGRVAAFVVAGGQGSRLGFDGPKGAFPIGPVTDRSLFQVLAEQLVAAARRYGRPVPWYVMVSESNATETREYFRKNDRFGLSEGDVVFLQQEMLPAVDANRRFLMESLSRVYTSPNGHGGSLKALHDRGALADMRDRGIDTISYFHVDNPLVRTCDPLFLGHHARAGADMSLKVVRKSSPTERVGLYCLREGRPTVVEYCDLPEEIAHATLSDGSLEFWAGSIGVHVLAVDFVAELNAGGFHLPYHAVRKSVPYVETEGSMVRELVRPKYSNALKFETFVFDALTYTRSPLALEVRRADHFAPVKNATGEDSPETSRHALTDLYLRWLEAAGATIERDSEGLFQGAVEISPLTALDADDVAAKLKATTTVRPGFRL